MLARRLLAGSVGSPAFRDYSAIFNGGAGAGSYDLGLARSADGGATWTPYAGNPVMLHNGAAWESQWLAQPSLVFDGTQYVVYYTGYDGTTRKIGRATSPDLVTWTRAGSNPVLSVGGGGTFDAFSVNFPAVIFDPSAVHPWQMWYTGWANSGATSTTIGYAWSADGISWTKVSKVLDVGAGGTFDASGLATGAVVRSGGDYTLYYGGYNGTYYHSGWATTSDPTNPAAYTKHGVLTGFSGDLTVGGITWHSNQLYALEPLASGFRVLVDVFHDGTGREAAAVTSATALGDNVSVPGSGLMLALGSGWDSNSAENPSLVPTP